MIGSQNKIKRILHYGLTDNLGGIEVFVMSLYRNIDRQKIQFDFIDHNGIYFSNEINKMGGNIIKIPTRRENFFIYRKMLNEILKSGLYTAVHVHALAVSNIDIIKIALKYNVKVILHSHMDMDLRNFKAEILHKYNRKWLEDKNKFKFNSDLRIRVREKLNIKNELLIGHVGRFAYQKNQEFLINIFNEILKIYSNSKLVLIGGDGGMLDVSKKLVKDLTLEDKVIFTGIQDNVDEYMQGMDIFVFPSRWEGLGIVLIEAQAAGLPCFTSDKVPDEAKVTENLFFLSLEESPKYWAEIIVDKYKEFIRKDVSNLLIENGYDIHQTAKYIENFYLDIGEKR